MTKFLHSKGLNIKHLGKDIKKSHIDKQIGGSVKNIAKTTEKSVGTVYKDAKGFLNKAGGILSNPLLLIGVGAVAFIFISNSRK